MARGRKKDMEKHESGCGQWVTVVCTSTACGFGSPRRHCPADHRPVTVHRPSAALRPFSVPLETPAMDDGGRPLGRWLKGPGRRLKGNGPRWKGRGWSLEGNGRNPHTPSGGAGANSGPPVHTDGALEHRIEFKPPSPPQVFSPFCHSLVLGRARPMGGNMAVRRGSRA